MSIPVQITFRHMLPSARFETRIHELARRLEKFSPRITSCHVVVEKPHQSKAQGALFDVHLSVCVPGNIIVVRRSHSTDSRHSNAYVALRDAFNAAKRCLQDYEKISRGMVKSHSPPSSEAEASA
jgi:ribosome-associated translation inhibitor RaiA